VPITRATRSVTGEVAVPRNRSRQRALPWIASLVILLPALWATTREPAGASDRPPSCAVVPAQTVSEVYGRGFGAPQSRSTGSVTVCSYLNPANGVFVLVRIGVGTTRQMFSAERAQFERHKEHTVTQDGIGTEAYSVVLGTAKAQTSTVVVLQGSTELLVTGTGLLTKAFALARKVLPVI
jgi:hypothetical protein